MPEGFFRGVAGSYQIFSGNIEGNENRSFQVREQNDHHFEFFPQFGDRTHRIIMVRQPLPF